MFLQTDVFVSAALALCVRNVCYEKYSLDNCQYYIASNLSGDTMLRICKAMIELLSHCVRLDMVENLNRGGNLSSYIKRFAVANNEYLKNF